MLENGTLSTSNLKLELTSTTPKSKTLTPPLEDSASQVQNLRSSVMVLVLYGFGFSVSYGFVCIGKLQGSVGFEGILL